jgi:hypothetical protein
MLMNTIVVAAVTCALAASASTMLAAPGQTGQPGQMTQAHVWVQNRGRGEAVPMDLREVNLDAPLKVQITNGDPGFPRTPPVQVTEIRKMWEYDTITVAPDANIGAILNRRGADGWETTGIAFAVQDGTTLLLKRPR